MEVFGLDIGGSGVKGAPVDVETGELKAKRKRLVTPQPATPEAVLETAAGLVRHFGWDGPVGCGFPAVIKAGVAQTAANVDASTVGFDFGGRLQATLGMPVWTVNDADAAGLAEVRWGAGRDVDGTVLMLTLGTGIGTALFTGGRLVPNTELGHIELRGMDAETYASAAARERENLSWRKFAGRFNEYLEAIERLLWPDRIIVGGGASKKADKLFPHLETRAEIFPAKLLNSAGIAGAALAATEAASTAPANS
ncbi:MAG: ROK family protein [Rubrobacter sp.]|nr:ROK family protein [Rubrobacter sp.]